MEVPLYAEADVAKAGFLPRFRAAAGKALQLAQELTAGEPPAPAAPPAPADAAPGNALTN